VPQRTFHWLKDRLTNFESASHQAVSESCCIAEDQESQLDYGNDWRLAELLRPELLGQSEDDPKL